MLVQLLTLQAHFSRDVKRIRLDHLLTLQRPHLISQSLCVPCPCLVKILLARCLYLVKILCVLCFCSVTIILLNQLMMQHSSLVRVSPFLSALSQPLLLPLTTPSFLAFALLASTLIPLYILTFLLPFQAFAFPFQLQSPVLIFPFLVRIQI